MSGIVRQTRWMCIAFLAILPGCLETSQERVHDFQDDGVFLFTRGEYGGARENFEMALALDPENARLLYNIGQCLDHEGEWKKAEQYYRTSLEKDPNYAECRFALVVLLYETDRKEEASRVIDQWLAANPEAAVPYVADGWRLRQEGDIISAMARVQQGLAKEPHNVRGLVEMGIIYERLDYPSRALTLYERALIENPRQPELVQRVSDLRAKKVGPPLPN